MNCNDCQELFSVLFDEEIDQHSRSQAEAHLASCDRCKAEWQSFKNTVSFLQQIPAAKVPPGFLAGIHDKLDQQSTWAKVKRWFSWKAQPQVALSTALAMLVLGFVTASLLQVIPFSQSDKGENVTVAPQVNQVAQNEETEQPSTILLAENDNEAGAVKEYYPGIPLLSEYEDQGIPAMEQFAMLPKKSSEPQAPMVDLVSAHLGRPSQPYLDSPLSSFSRAHQAPVIKPDLFITLHTSADDKQIERVRKIIQSPLWQAKVFNNDTLLLSVPAGNFDILRQICCQSKASFTPEYARKSRYLSPKKMLTVAVRID